MLILLFRTSNAQLELYKFPGIIIRKLPISPGSRCICPIIWRVIGITGAVLKKFHELNYKYFSGHGITRPHLKPRIETDPRRIYRPRTAFSWARGIIPAAHVIGRSAGGRGAPQAVPSARHFPTSPPLRCPSVAKMPKVPPSERGAS